MSSRFNLHQYLIYNKVFIYIYINIYVYAYYMYMNIIR